MTTATEPKVHRMKYKHIDSVLRNFGHSFASLMNYVDDVYICDLLDAAARDSESGEIQINFSGEVADLPANSAPALKKSFEFSKAWLPKLLEGHNVELARLNSIVLRYKLTAMGREVLMQAVDDRSIQHHIHVKNTL